MIRAQKAVCSLSSTVWFKCPQLERCWGEQSLLRKKGQNVVLVGQPKAVCSYFSQSFLQDPQQKTLMFKKKKKKNRKKLTIFFPGGSWVCEPESLQILQGSYLTSLLAVLLWKATVVLLFCPTALMLGYLKGQPCTGSLQPHHALHCPPSEKGNLSIILCLLLSFHTTSIPRKWC